LIKPAEDSGKPILDSPAAVNYNPRKFAWDRKKSPASIIEKRGCFSRAQGIGEGRWTINTTA